MQAVILVGGEGTRLRPLTYSVPKVMLPVLNHPFLELTIGYFHKYGVRDIILASGYLSDAVVSYFGDGDRFGARLTYAVEKKPLGTAGAVKNTASLLQDTFFALNGDIFTELDMGEMLAFHRQKKSKVTIALTAVEDPTRFGVVETDPDGRIKSFKEKPSRDAITSNLINAGIYIIEPEVLEYVPEGHYMFEQGLFPLLLEKKEPVFGFVITDYWLDMGTPEQYLKLNYDLLLQSRGKDESKDYHIHPSARLAGPIVIGSGSVLAAEVKIKGPAVLGPDCIIGAGSTIEGAVLWRGVKVSENTVIRNSIIASGSSVEENCLLENGCIIGEGAIVRRESHLAPGTRVEGLTKT